MSVSTGEASSPLRSVGVAVAVAVVGIVVGTALVLGSLTAIQASGVRVTPLGFIVASLVLLQGVAFGGVALGYLRYRGLTRDYLGVRVPSLPEVGAVVVGYVVAIGVAITGAIIVSVAGVQAGSNQAAELGAENPEVLLLLIPASILIIGPGEELLFRGVVQNRLRETFDAVPGIVIASAIFAAIHFVALSGGAGARLVSIVVLFFPSLVFGAVYEFSKNLVVPALVHGIYNATLFTLLYVAIQFGGAQPM
ncbi:CPBP family intramembrane glutamic endopeptidase [Salinigranum halophilum]|uniref:CPBP family intramembrane glutamic endopeptidase n=1 Tax=Salinigranum halophilum TaxID=2565931 RepID=UPI0010A8EF2E|nr:CPBP family intramembrane glutamic endopeptidase [Salinigranum halophilum]